MRRIGLVLVTMVLGAGAQARRTMTVGAGGEFATVQAAVDAAPAAGGAVIRIKPGVYREVVHVDKPDVELRGEGGDATKVVIVFDNGDPKTCGTFCSPTMFVTGDGFVAEDLTIANDLSKRGKVRTQGVALSLTADRAVLRRVRLLGAQDTLFASSKKCAAGEVCRASRQYFADSYIEGEVDFLFGNAKAWFEGCEVHSIVHPDGGFLTAQSRNSAAEDSGYVIDRGKLTADAGVTGVYLGRPWRDFATVTFLRTEMGAHIAPEGWREWHPGETERLKTATYAEGNSTGPGATGERLKMREPYSKQLSKEEVKAMTVKGFFGDWDPTGIK